MLGEKTREKFALDEEDDEGDVKMIPKLVKGVLVSVRECWCV